MEGETDKFAVVCEIYSHLTEKNRENLIRLAENLLETQKDNTKTGFDETAAFLTSDEKGV
jgi:hypothetical protein